MSTVNIIVESRLNGSASGQLQVTTSLEATAVNLIVAFCNEKGITNPVRYVLRSANDRVLDNKQPLSSFGLGDGDVVYLTNRSFGDDQFGYGTWLLMAAACVIIATFGLVSVGMIYSTTGEIPDDYGIVFDAGSTHTTMMLYKWSGAKLNDTGTPQQVHKCEMQGGGISMFVGREDQLADALQKCLSEGKYSLYGGKVSTTPVLLGATGGMRILNEQNPDEVKKLFQTIDQTFANSGFKYQDGYADIISGYAEGADAWVTSNYLANTIIPNKNVNFSLGTLDLGGASTQWAYQVADNGTVDLDLYGLPRSVLTNSSLCFGGYQSQIRHTAQLTVGLTDAKQNVTDACLPKGLQMQISLRDVFSSPCAQMDNNLRPNLPESTNITIVGSSSSVNCSRQLASLFNESECMQYYKYKHCFTSHNLSETLMPYLAISGFYDVIYKLNLTDAPFTLPQFKAAVTAVCQKTLPELMTLSTRGGSSSAVQNFCYLGHYVDQLLTTGYSFNNETWGNLNFANTFNGTDLGWTLGFMINATTSIAAELPLAPLDPIVFAMLVTLFCMFVLLAVAFTVHAWKRRQQQFPTEYHRISQYGAI